MRDPDIGALIRRVSVLIVTLASILLVLLLHKPQPGEVRRAPDAGARP